MSLRVLGLSPTTRGLLGLTLALVVACDASGAPGQPRATGPQPVAGDVNGFTNSNVVNDVSGASPIGMNTSTLLFDAGSVPFITQVAQPSTSTAPGTAGTALTLSAQPGQAATNNWDGGAGGPLTLQLAAGGASTGGTGGRAGCVFIAQPDGGATDWQICEVPGTPAQLAIYVGSVTASATNYALTVTSTGGTASLNGTTFTNLQVGGTAKLTAEANVLAMIEGIAGNVAGGNGLTFASTGYALDAGTNTPANTVSSYPWLQLNGSLAASVTLVLPTGPVGACWWLDFNGVTFNGHTVSIAANSNTWGTSVTAATDVYWVCYGTAGKLFGIALTP